MLKKLILIATLVAGIAACKSNTKSARDYNNSILAQEKKLEPIVMAAESNVKKYNDAGQFDSIAAAGEEMEIKVQKTIDEINSLTVPKAKQVDNFKAAVIRYFTFIKSLYTNYKEYGQAGTDEKRQGILQAIQKAASERQDQVNDMQAAQRIFATVNGFKIEAKTY